MRLKKKGFTLVELLVVVAIMGIIVAIAVPVVVNQIDKSRTKSDITNLDNLGQNTFVCITQLNNRGIEVSINDLLTNVYDVYQGRYDAGIPTNSTLSTAPHLILPRAMKGGYPPDNEAYYTIVLIAVKNGTTFEGNGFEVAYYDGKDNTKPAHAKRFMVKGLRIAADQGDNFVTIDKAVNTNYNDPIVKVDIEEVLPEGGSPATP